MQPDEGYYRTRTRPAGTLSSGATQRLQDLWAKFWEVANDAPQARQAGVKAMHGQAVYGRLLPHKVYMLVMRSTGELILPGPTEPMGSATP